MNAVMLLKQVNSPLALQHIFEKAGRWVSRYEIIEKTDGKSFGIYLYKDNIKIETNLINDILSYLDASDRLRHFVLENYVHTPDKEEFCIHFPLDSNALIRTHTKPTEEEHFKFKRDELGILGIKGFTLFNSGQIKDIKYYYMKGYSIITTLKYSLDGKLLDTLVTNCTQMVKKENSLLEIIMNREDGQTYKMYSHNTYDSFAQEGETSKNSILKYHKIAASHYKN